ncbi:hypothetical protein QTJ16_001587 [Diplocarpon rosae]|uniref:Uncharacterized protein n=1 Tax=Diplocarpon rosae TaxID=946125 RepID=A0AAD9T495_9HELO|nr:hypothetical protein QTJ16_001587 [Diplocarpon rosae]
MASGQPDNKVPPPADAIAGENGQPVAPALEGKEDVGEEEQLEQALKTLKEMHIQVSQTSYLVIIQNLNLIPEQLRGLRTTIPRLIAPLTSKQPSPEALFRGFSDSANLANQEVQEFRRLMTDEKSVEVMEQARRSRAANPRGIKPWRVTEHSDWLTRDS